VKSNILFHLQAPKDKVWYFSHHTKLIKSVNWFSLKITEFDLVSNIICANETVVLICCQFQPYHTAIKSGWHIIIIM